MWNARKFPVRLFRAKCGCGIWKLSDKNKKKPLFFRWSKSIFVSAHLNCSRNIYIFISLIDLENNKVPCLIFPFSICKMCISHKTSLIMNSLTAFLSSQPPEQSSCWCNKIRVSSHSRTDGLRRAMRRQWCICGVLSFALFMFIFISSSLQQW